jgi:hypothetical protein
VTAPVATDPVVEWLLAGDVAVQYQTRRDLLGDADARLQSRIATEGEGAALLAARGADGHWGRGFYQPKWTCSHYTLLELRGLECPRGTAAAVETTRRILTEELSGSLGLRPGSLARGDVCVVGMALDYGAWFQASSEDLVPLVDFVLGMELPGGGFNCQSNRKGATHPALNSTLCVIEGITSYHRAGHEHRLDDLIAARARAVETLLDHHLFRSHRTGEVIRDDFTRLHHPARWHYDVLRALDALRAADIPGDERMDDALEVLAGHRLADGRWPVHRGYPGETHLPLPRAGRPNGWITLKASRVLARYRPAGSG